jgi:hypothetical protein
VVESVLASAEVTAVFVLLFCLLAVLGGKSCFLKPVILVMEN